MTLTDTPYLAMALNNAWANATFYQALAGLSDAEFTAPRPGFFDSLARTMNHIYEVDLYYVDALTQGGKGRSVYVRSDIMAAKSLAQAQRGVDLALAQFCKDAAPDLLCAPRQTERKDETVTERVDALLLHLFQHQVHHRGQAHVQLHAAGIAPPQLDDFYLDYGRVPSAAAYWPAA